MSHEPTDEQIAFRKLVRRCEQSLFSEIDTCVTIVRSYDGELEPHCCIVMRNVLAILPAIYEQAYDEYDETASYYRTIVKAIVPNSYSNGDLFRETELLFGKKLPDEFIYATVRNGSNHGADDLGLTLKRAKACLRFLGSEKFAEMIDTINAVQAGRLWLAPAQC